MASFQAPNFQERAQLAKDAKAKALEKLKNKPPVDPAVVEQRKIAEAAREASQEAKRQARKAEQAQKEAEKVARKLAEVEAAKEAEKARMQKEIVDKLARDERYAARKQRKGGK
jgi:DNA-binding helix-hairpin-helix protein with protein kinase domain